MIRIGLLGAARIAPKAIVSPVSKRDDCIIVAVGARQSEKAQRFIEENNLDARATVYEAICTDRDIDMVYCALPPSEHIKWVTLALENGKAVLCEKPSAMNADETRAMAAAASQHKRPLMEAFHYYFHPAFQTVLSIVKSGEMGPVTGFDGIFNAHIKKRPGELRYVKELGGGGLMDLGCYPLHAFRSLVGEPEIVSAEGEFDNGVDVRLSATLKANGVTGQMSSSMIDEKIARLDIGFEKGRIIYDGFVGPQFGYTLTIERDTGTEVINEDSGVTYDWQLAHFIDVINGAEQKLTQRDAIAQMDAIDRIYASAGRR